MGRAFIYMDGLNLFHAVGDKFIWLDLIKLANLILSRCDDELELGEVYYFISEFEYEQEELAVPGTIHGVRPATRKKNKEDQQIYLVALKEANSKVHVRRGRFANHIIRCRKPGCGAEWDLPKEKETDVRMGCQMLHDAYRLDFSTVIVLSRDSDFLPAIEFVREAGKKVIVVSPEEKGNWHLKQAANDSFSLKPEMYLRCPLREDIESDGKLLPRLDDWSPPA